MNIGRGHRTYPDMVSPRRSNRIAALAIEPPSLCGHPGMYQVQVQVLYLLFYHIIWSTKLTYPYRYGTL